jgi:hypothetical protein
MYVFYMYILGFICTHTYIHILCVYMFKYTKVYLFISTYLQVYTVFRFDIMHIYIYTHLFIGHDLFSYIIFTLFSKAIHISVNLKMHSIYHIAYIHIYTLYFDFGFKFNQSDY